MHRIKLTITLFLALAATLAVTACGGSKSATTTAASTGESLSGQSITLYNGQHEQTTVAAGRRPSNGRPGIKVDVRSRRRGRRSPTRSAGGLELPGGRLLHREHAGAGSAARARAAGAASHPSTLAPVPARYSSAQGRLGGRLRARCRCSSTTPTRSHPAQLPELDPRTGRRRAGRASSRFAPSETDFQPLVTSIAKLEGTRRRRSVAEGAAGQRHDLPRQRDRRRPGQRRRRAQLGPINHYYWYRLRDEVGRSGLHSALHYYAPHDPGYLLNVSGAAVLKSSSHQAAAQSVPGIPRQRAPARKCSPTATATSTRCARAWPRRRGCAPLASSSPPLTPRGARRRQRGAGARAEGRAPVGRPPVSAATAPPPTRPAVGGARGRRAGAGRWSRLAGGAGRAPRSCCCRCVFLVVAGPAVRLGRGRSACCFRHTVAVLLWNTVRLARRVHAAVCAARRRRRRGASSAPTLPAQAPVGGRCWCSRSGSPTS